MMCSTCGAAKATTILREGTLVRPLCLECMLALNPKVENLKPMSLRWGGSGTQKKGAS